MPRPMRKQYNNNLTGVLFDNDRRSKDGDPDLKGSVEVEGVEYWVAAWWNQHAQRGDYLKIKLTPKATDDRSPQQRNNDYNRGEARGPQHGGNRGGYEQQEVKMRDTYRGRQPTSDEMDDDIPFN